MAVYHGSEALAEQKINVIYDPKSFQKPHLYDSERKYALLVVDMLNDFITGTLKCARATPIIPRIQGLVDAARSSSIPLIYSKDSHRPKDFEVRSRWAPHAMRGTKGADVIPELKPQSGDYSIPKTTYSSFYNTDLDDVLRSLYDGTGANTLLLTGVHTDCCIRHTCADAFFRGYETFVMRDAVNSFTESQHQFGLQYIQYWYTTGIVSTREMTRRLSGRTR